MRRVVDRFPCHSAPVPGGLVLRPTREVPLRDTVEPSNTPDRTGAGEPCGLPPALHACSSRPCWPSSGGKLPIGLSDACRPRGFCEVWWMAACDVRAGTVRATSRGGRTNHPPAVHRTSAHARCHGRRPAAPARRELAWVPTYASHDVDSAPAGSDARRRPRRSRHEPTAPAAVPLWVGRRPGRVRYAACGRCAPRTRQDRAPTARPDSRTSAARLWCAHTWPVMPMSTHPAVEAAPAPKFATARQLPAMAGQ